MDVGGSIALFLFVGTIILLFPRQPKTEKKPEPPPETYVEIPQEHIQGGYPLMPYPSMPTINPVTNHQIGGNRILKVGNRLYLQQQLPAPENGTPEGGGENHG